MTDAPPFEEALARLRAALADVANGDVAAIKALYAQTDDATSFYGWGGYEKGWEQVSRRWDWAGQQFKGGTVRHRKPDRGRHLRARLCHRYRVLRDRNGWGGRPASWSNRVTHVFRLIDGEWRLIHRHANRLEDRFEPARRLAPK